MPRWGDKSIKELTETLNEPEDKYSLKHMRFLCDLCEKHSSNITPKTKGIMVETFRQLSELIIWGDQHDPQFFDIFLEKTVLTYLMQVLHQNVVEVKIQLLQTLSILIQNLKSEMALFFLLSNNYINDLITYKWDFTNEDVLTNYVSFLKTISLKLNTRTIQFFFNGMKKTFPLYTEAIKFHDNKESMVRIAVRTLTLNVFKVEDSLMQQFVIEETAAAYFSEIILFFIRLCKKANEILERPSYNDGDLQDTMEELLDLFYYLHDILSLNIEKLSRILTFHLVEYLLIPLFARNLQQSGSSENSVDPVVRLKLSLTLFLLAEFFFIFSHGPLINAAGAIFIHPKPEQYSSFYQLIPQLEKFNHPPDYSLIDKPKETVKEVEQPPSQLDALYAFRMKSKAVSQTVQPKARTKSELCSVRSELIGLLEKDNDQIILGILCVLYAIVRNNNFERKLLSQSGLFPHRLEKVQSIFESLVSDNSQSNSTRTKGLFGDSDSTSDLFAEPKDTLEIPTEEFNKKIVDCLLSILLHGEKYRIITLELTLLILKELVYSESKEPKLTPQQKDNLQIAYKMSAANLRDRLVNSEVGEVFLELFEEEWKSFRPVNFENLVTDYSLLCPIPRGPVRGVPFTMRLPSGDLEETRKAVQGFILTRKLKYTLQKQKDTLLPLKESAIETPDRSIVTSVEIQDQKTFSCHITSVHGVGDCLLMTEGPYLLVVRQSTDKSSYDVQEFLELQNIEVAVSQGDSAVLLTKAGSMAFETAEQCEEVKVWIELEKQNVRHRKLEQLYELLGINTADAKNISRRRSKPVVSEQIKPHPSSDELLLEMVDGENVNGEPKIEVQEDVETSSTPENTNE